MSGRMLAGLVIAIVGGCALVMGLVFFAIRPDVAGIALGTGGTGLALTVGGAVLMWLGRNLPPFGSGGTATGDKPGTDLSPLGDVVDGVFRLFD